MDTRKLEIEESAREHEMEIQDQDGQRLGTVWLEGPDTATGEEMAFGVELVRRWNHFPALVEALEEALSDLQSPDMGGLTGAEHDAGAADGTIIKIREALEAASE